MTTAKVTPKVGDRVRVTVEGEVSYAAEGNFDIGVFATLFPARAPGGALTVEILPPPVRVGDVATREVLDALPYASIVVTANGRAVQRGSYGAWRRSGQNAEWTAEDIAKWHPVVIFIPDPQ